jgi:hypothetical protein
VLVANGGSDVKVLLGAGVFDAPMLVGLAVCVDVVGELTTINAAIESTLSSRSKTVRVTT